MPKETGWFTPSTPISRRMPVPYDKLVSLTEDAFVDTRGNIDITYKQWACSSCATQGRVNLHRRPIKSQG